MAKGKTSKRKGYVSKGLVGKNKQILKQMRRDNSDFLSRFNRAMKAWQKGQGQFAPKIIRDSLGVAHGETYRDWAFPRKEKNKLKELLDQ